MRHALSAALVTIAVTLVPSPLYAWGFVGHRLIMSRAIDLLPPALKPFFDANKTEIVVRVVDPDVWRNVPWDDSPNHFVDFGMPELGPPPFDALPRSYDAALQKFGMATLRNIGLLPWREAEMFGSLARAFAALGHGQQFSPSNVILFSAVASHYIEDAYQPLHASNNFDGQLTGNAGIHARFETDLIVRYQSQLVLSPAPPRSIPNPRDAAFAALIASHGQVDALLAADTRAAAGKDAYDDDYFAKLLEKQLSDAITATASVIVSAWDAAGKPHLPLDEPMPVQKIKK
jgi:hypothetical protein